MRIFSLHILKLSSKLHENPFMISPISNVLQGMQGAMEKLHTTSQKVASGDFSVEDVVDIKISKNEIKADQKVVKAINDMEDEILDILA